MTWKLPLPLRFVVDDDPDGFRRHPPGTTGLPIGPRHPGSFGFVRKNHVHEGVDFCCPVGTEVRAVEEGVVVAIIPFTGPSAIPPSPWWHETSAVLVEGESGVVVYGELRVAEGLHEGQRLDSGALIGTILQVLTRDKGRPMAMLHLELHAHSTRDAYEWTEASGRPPSLLDPTEKPLEAIRAEDE